MNSLSTNLYEIPGRIDVPNEYRYVPHVNEWGLVDSTNLSKNLELKIGERVMLIYSMWTS